MALLVFLAFGFFARAAFPIRGFFLFFRVGVDLAAFAFVGFLDLFFSLAQGLGRRLLRRGFLKFRVYLSFVG